MDHMCKHYASILYFESFLFLVNYCWALLQQLINLMFICGWRGFLIASANRNRLPIVSWSVNRANEIGLHVNCDSCRRWCFISKLVHLPSSHATHEEATGHRQRPPCIVFMERPTTTSATSLLRSRHRSHATATCILRPGWYQAWASAPGA